MEDVLLIRIDEAARRLGLGRSMTYRFIQSGELPSIKIGGARRVLVADLGVFIKRLQDDGNDD
jgi:excisionase family DNA binding protein